MTSADGVIEHLLRRSRQKGQSPRSPTLSRKKLVAGGRHTMLLDGDNVRHGLITLTSFISPYARDRSNAKEIIGDSFVEIHVSTPLEECERRDVKGLYAKARAGEIPNFTGVSSPYEAPENPDIDIDTSRYSLEEATDYVVEQITGLLDKEEE